MQMKSEEEGKHREEHKRTKTNVKWGEEQVNPAVELGSVVLCG